MVMLLKPFDLYPVNAEKPAFTLLDVRAPVEVARGALPFSVYEPILTNEERHQVGIRYKEDGQQAAIDLGFDITRPFLEARIRRWLEVCQASPTAVMCWRGGLRSKLAHEFIDLPTVARLEGGYKALRNYLMETLPHVLEHKQIVVLTGLTGAGKTEVLKGIERDEEKDFSPPVSQTGTELTNNLQIVDLEKEACHKGSAFGNLGEQPSQQTFENGLAVQILLSPAKTVLLEDESYKIGKLFLPDPLWEKLKTAPLVVLESMKEERVQRIFDEYVREETTQHGLETTFEKLESNLLKLRPRLGGANTSECLKTLQAAKEGGWLEPSAHAPWIEVLLDDYYDPLYKKAIAKHERPALFRGSAEECKAWLASDARGNAKL
jgi:tRNA 2-selenouridine synthase